MAVCVACGTDNARGSRFCSACGRPVASGRARSRKIVTILFDDVTGSTELGERFDPESVQELMARYFGAVRAVVERHGGTVEKFIGDAVMAAFGIPTLHEDDALRAVRSSVEIAEAIDALNHELEERFGTAIEMRMGVNTGEVVAGEVGDGQAFATGDAVNLAARLQQAAEPGEILLGPETHRLVRDCVDAVPRGQLALKGKQATVAAWRLLAVKPE